MAAPSESILGWKPPVVYDPQTDEYRVANQDDVDRLEEISRLYSELVSLVQNKLEEQRSALGLPQTKYSFR